MPPVAVCRREAKHSLIESGAGQVQRERQESAGRQDDHDAIVVGGMRRRSLLSKRL